MSQHNGGRQRRVGEQIQRELAMLIHHDLDDPRFQWITVAGVKVTRDFAYATVYISILDNLVDNAEAHDTDKIMGNLIKASGFLRHELGRRISLRVVPELKFVLDETIQRGTKLSKMIDDAVAADQKLE